MRARFGSVVLIAALANRGQDADNTRARVRDTLPAAVLRRSTADWR